MQIRKIDRQSKYIEVIPDSLDDLWYLEKIIEEQDIVKSKTTRILPPKAPGGKKERINMFLEIQVKKVEFDKHGPRLRILGTIIGGRPEEFIELKAHHTLDLQIHDLLKLEKKELSKWHIDRLKKAEEASKKAKLGLIAIDDERADIALLKEYGLEEVATIFSGKSGKQYKADSSEKSYFTELFEKLKDLTVDKLIIAGPGFTRSNFKDFLKDKSLGKQLFFEPISAVGTTGLNEIIKRGLIEKVIKEATLVQENKLIDRLNAEIFRDSKKVTYGLEQIKKAVQLKAVSELLVLDELLFEKRDEIQAIMTEVEKNSGKIHLISKEHEAGQKLKGFTGIAAFLWFEI